MKITQIRNATLILEYKDNHIIVDPMLSDKGTIPRFRIFNSKGRKPLVELPKEFHELSSKVTHALITHCQKGHVDHLDKKGEAFLRNNKVHVFSTFHDEKYLKKKGLQTTALKKEGQGSLPA